MPGSLPQVVPPSASDRTGPPPRSARIALGAAGGFVMVAGLAAVLFFFHLGTYGLWEPDEARYAEIAREMLATRSFVVPHLNYVPYIEKPPLLYWLTAASMALLGVGQFSARLVNALAGLLGVCATYLFVLRTFDGRRAILAGAILATSTLYAVMAQVLTTDMLLTAMMTVAMFAFFLQWREGGRWWLLLYGAIGLALLTKGPIGAAIPLVVAVIFLWCEGTLGGALRRFHLPAGVILATALSLPWFVAISLRQHGFFDFYFIGEYLRRFLQPHYSHSGPLYYYVPVLAGGFLPWTVAVPVIPWRRLAPSAARRFCYICAAVIFVLFSLAKAKLVPYILPAFPFIAVVTADGLMAFAGGAHKTGGNGRDPRWLAATLALLALAGVLVIVVALNADRLASPYPAIVRPALYAGGAVVTLCAMACCAALWARRTLVGIGLLTAGAAATLIVMTYGRIMAEPTRSYATLARQIERLAPHARLICYPRYIQSLPFYCRRRVILVGAKTELAWGASHSPNASRYFFTGPDDVLRLWRQPQGTVLVIDRSVLPQLESRLGPFKVIASDARKLALTHGGRVTSSVATSGVDRND